MSQSTNNNSQHLTDDEFKTQLQQACPGFAYTVMLLQMIVEGYHPQRKANFQDINKLIQMYMLAVQILQGQSDPRFAYFNLKIQDLLIKQQVVEQLCLQQGRKASASQLRAGQLAHLDHRKDQHQMNLYVHQASQMDRNVIADLVKKEEAKRDIVRDKLSRGLNRQEMMLEERIRSRRKQRSQNSSLSKSKSRTGREREESLRKDNNNSSLLSDQVDQEYFDQVIGGPIPKGPKLNRKQTMSQSNINHRM